MKEPSHPENPARDGTDPEMLERAGSLMRSCWQTVETRVAHPTGERIAMPAVVPANPKQPSGANFDGPFAVLDHYPAALQIADESGFAEIVAGLQSLGDDLRWSQNASYRRGRAPDQLLNGYAYAGLAGPGGLIPCASPLCGFMLMGPEVCYPAHNHAPPEIYLVLTPGTEWQLDRGGWFGVSAGKLIHHQAWQWHGTRTRDAPMLAFAAWLEPGQRAEIAMDIG